MKLHRLACALALLCLSQLACAQAYKCTQDGKTSYQDRPCPTGKGIALDLPGAFAPPGSAGGASPREAARGLVIAHVMAVRCPLSANTQTAIEMLGMMVAPTLKLSRQELDGIEIAATRDAQAALASPMRAAACNRIERDVETAFRQIPPSSRTAKTGARPPAAKPTL